MDEARGFAIGHGETRASDTALQAKIRLDVLSALHQAGGGHFGGCLSCVDLLLALFLARNLAGERAGGDRLLLSKGHASMTLYAVLSAVGNRNLPLETFGKFGSPLQGHPDKRRLSDLDFSFGSLGQGIGVGIGYALALREEGRHVWVLLGDGECQEGMVWESAMVAARYQVHNLHVIVDANSGQECGWGHDQSLCQEPVPHDVAKWRAFGWCVAEADGHDMHAVKSWIKDAGEARSAPSVLIARTNKSVEGGADLSRFRTHATSLSGGEYRATKRAIERQSRAVE